jgi:hypothetical protein
MRSSELAPSWNRPIRFLWIDGDHSYEGARSDLDAFMPYLSDGAIVGFHDTLNYFEGPVRVFTESVLLNPHFGPTGLCGTIAWGRYFRDPTRSAEHRAANLRLYRRLSGLVPLVAFDGRPRRWWERALFSYYSWRAPHREIKPREWADLMGCPLV